MLIEALEFEDQRPPLRNSLMSTMRSSLAEAIASVPSTTSVDVLCDLLREAGLLGVADVTFLKKTLSAPVTMGQVERLLLSQNEPARRAQIEKVINDAAARVRHLSGVLGEWRLEEMSPAQTANLLGMLEQLQRRLRTSGELLQSWSDGFRAALGPEETQTLFWDLVDGAAGGEYSAHAFQRDQLAAIEQRVARRRVKSCVQQPNETEKLAHGVTRGIGKCATRGFRLRVYRAPHRGVPWGFMSSLLSSMDAARAQFAAQFSAQFSAQFYEEFSSTDRLSYRRASSRSRRTSPPSSATSPPRRTTRATRAGSSKRLRGRRSPSSSRAAGPSPRPPSSSATGGVRSSPPSSTCRLSAPSWCRTPSPSTTFASPRTAAASCSMVWTSAPRRRRRS